MRRDVSRHGTCVAVSVWRSGVDLCLCTVNIGCGVLWIFSQARMPWQGLAVHLNACSRYRAWCFVS